MKNEKSTALAYVAPQAELLLIRMECNFLVSEGGSGQNIQWTEEEDFDPDFTNCSDTSSNSLSIVSDRRFCNFALSLESFISPEN